ncbi:hypothetical protein BTVI_134509 [Pitangus sulphuratus]|nr:hypothetical protein BTVI_134509 [Pitangus sulphuratus]
MPEEGCGKLPLAHSDSPEGESIGVGMNSLFEMNNGLNMVDQNLACANSFVRVILPGDLAEEAVHRPENPPETAAHFAVAGILILLQIGADSDAIRAELPGKDPALLGTASRTGKQRDRSDKGKRTEAELAKDMGIDTSRD